MDVREAAAKGLKLFGSRKQSEQLGLNPVDHLMLKAYFLGVDRGTITTGQSWMAQIVMRIAECVGKTSQESELMSGLSEIVASGMCCEGQVLKTSRRGRDFGMVGEGSHTKG